jgi:hypothetical protein
MTTKRTPLNRAARVRLSPETLDLFIRLQDIRAAGADAEWEPIGRRSELLEGSAQLHAALGLRPWDECPLFVDDGPPQAWRDTAEQIAAYTKAQDLRRQLIAAVKDATP